MQLNAYSVYDNKALVYGVPFFAPTDGSAIRSFRSAANDKDTTIGNHPNDFSLFHVGGFDDQSGGVSTLLPLRHVVDASTLVVQPAQIPLFPGKES